MTDVIVVVDGIKGNGGCARLEYDLSLNGVVCNNDVVHFQKRFFQTFVGGDYDIRKFEVILPSGNSIINAQPPKNLAANCKKECADCVLTTHCFPIFYFMIMSTRAIAELEF